jgi:uncharacterized SAM-binding protein YcdF (DUF218 family)
VELGVREYNRLRTEEGRDCIMIMTGGRPKKGVPCSTEAAVMKTAAERLGVQPECIVVEEDALYTIHNAFFVAPILRAHSVENTDFCVVTSDFHRNRVEQIFYDWLQSDDAQAMDVQVRYLTTPPMDAAAQATYFEETNNTFEAIIRNEETQTKVPDEDALSHLSEIQQSTMQVRGGWQSFGTVS